MSQGTDSPIWDSIRQRPNRWKLEWVAEKGIFVISLSAILMVFLIFLFVTREGLPVLLGAASKPLTEAPIPVEQWESTPPEKLEQYLGLTADELQSMDPETLKLLMEVKLEEINEASTDKDAEINTAHWRYLIFPYQWSGYEKPEYIWQPISEIQKYNIIPLLIGSLKTSMIALLFAVPISVGAAIYISQLAPARVREWVKPIVEMLAGIPSVVLGFFALVVMASTLQDVFGYPSRLNALVAGIVLGLAVIPIVFSLSEDALSSVPFDYTQAAYALGSTRWQAAYAIALPSALPGILAAIMLGFYILPWLVMGEEEMEQKPWLTRTFLMRTTLWAPVVLTSLYIILTLIILVSSIDAVQFNAHELYGAPFVMAMALALFAYTSRKQSPKQIVSVVLGTALASIVLASSKDV